MKDNSLNTSTVALAIVPESNLLDDSKEQSCDNESKFLFGFSKRHILFFTFYGITNILRAAFILSTGPFYPPEAEARNVSATEIGFVFAVHDFTSFLMSFLYGTTIIKSIGPQNVLHFCIFGIGICYIAFGCLAFITNRTLFTTFSLLLRVVNGAFDGGIYPSLFTIYALEIPSSISTGVSIFEVFFGIGAVAGPLVIGFVIEPLGFKAVFASLGVLVLLSGLISSCICPKVHRATPECLSPSSSYPEGMKQLLRVLSIPTVLLVIFSLSTASASIGFITATLQLHYSSLSSSMTGLLFSSGTVIYTVLCPMWGYIADKGYLPKNIICSIGGIIIAIAFSILGPLPFLPTETKDWEGFVGYAIHGIGIGASIMTAYHHALEAALQSGLPDNTATYSLVSGIYTGTFALGNSIGPAISGVLYDIVGFRWGTMFIIVLAILVAFASTILEAFRRSKRR